MKRIILAVLVMLALGSIATPAHAVGLQLAPLEYRTTLGKGEAKKGFIDISNPSPQTLEVATSVQGFRQTDDDGNLAFFDDEQLKAGVKLDLDSFTLEPREALRMYFEIDGTKLPTGDVYGAIFFTSQQKDSEGIQPEVRVGTLLSIVNQTPGQRQAEITAAHVSWLQLDKIRGTYAIKNTADPTTSTGFYPEVTLTRQPLNAVQHATGSLLFAGRTRTNDFTVAASWPGIYKVTVGYGASSVSSYVLFLTTPVLVGGLIVDALLLVLAIHFLLYRRRRARADK